MVNRILTQMKSSLNEVRVESYRQTGDTDFDLIVTYLWSVALGESLHPALQATEVSLRNAIHRVMNGRHRLRTGRDTSWLAESDYFSQHQQKALREIRKRYRDRTGTEPTDDQIISASNMGFWAAILSERYERLIWERLGYNMLWEMFPHAPKEIDGSRRSMVLSR